MALRVATDDDWAAVTGTQAPFVWFGIADAGTHMIDGLGAIYLDAFDRWWLVFQRAPTVRKVHTAHRAAKQLLGIAQERGIVVHTLADPRIEGSVAWIKRLGFRRTDEIVGGHPVWVQN